MFNTPIIPHTETGAKPPMFPSVEKNEFAERTQRVQLSAALAAAKHDNLTPLITLVNEAQAKRDKTARATWEGYRLRRTTESENVIGIVTPPRLWNGQTVSFLYRMEKGEDGTTRFAGCPDQAFVDQVNAAIEEIRTGLPADRKSLLDIRLTTKHALILALKQEAIAEGGNWYRAEEHPYPIIDASTGELVCAGGESPEPLPTLTFCFGPLLKGAVLGTFDEIDLDLQVCRTTPCYIKSKEPAVTAYTLMGSGQNREAFELVTGMPYEEKLAVMNRLHEAICKDRVRLAILKARATETSEGGN